MPEGNNWGELLLQSFGPTNIFLISANNGRTMEKLQNGKSVSHEHFLTVSLFYRGRFKNVPARLLGQGSQMHFLASNLVPRSLTGTF
jgi:hypothetical protein